MERVDALSEPELLASARGGDAAAFERLVASYRDELHAHCYRMLGSVQDAEDALQESLLGVWRGLAGFEGRSSLRAWLYRVSTNACLRLIARRPRRMLIEHDLVDEFRLMIDPVVLGGGKRLFHDDGALRAIRLVDSQAVTTGAILATYARVSAS